MQRKHVFSVVPGLFGNISKSRNIWGGDFHRTWTVKVTLLALGYVQFISITVQVRQKSPPQIFPELLMLYQTLPEWREKCLCLT